MIVFDVEQILSEYSNMVYKIALSHTEQQQDAEDVFQEVFLRLIKYRTSIKDENHLKAWLIRVTLNCCKDIFSSPWQKSRSELQDDIPADEAEDNEDIYAHVKELPDMYRTVIHLFYYEDMSIKDIAGILEEKEATVKSKLSRARKMLEEKIKAEEQRR